MASGDLARSLKRQVQDRARNAVRAAGDQILTSSTGLRLSTPALRWTYGHPLREFPPHRGLNGRTFTNLDDPALAVRGRFPPGGRYYPGDHAGCLCGVDVVYDRRVRTASAWRVSYRSSASRFEARFQNAVYDPDAFRLPPAASGSFRGVRLAVARAAIPIAITHFHERILDLRRWDAELAIALASRA